MEVFKIVTTVFNALFMFFVGWVGVTADKKDLRTCIALIVLMIMNLFCIWG